MLPHSEEPMTIIEGIPLVIRCDICEMPKGIFKITQDGKIVHPECDEAKD